MSERIIAGRFETKEEADKAAGMLSDFISTDDVCIFHNNAPGQHDAHAMGGDEDEDPGSRDADTGSASTAATAGITAGAIGAMGGPVTALVAGGVGAYVGSLMGAVDKLGDDEDKNNGPDRRPAGVMLSVRIAKPADEERVISTLRAQGAADIERAEGEWRDGDWVDFNPVQKPKLITNMEGNRP
jgi:hypothetical protein